MADRCRHLLPSAAMFLDQFALRRFEAVTKIVEPLLALVNSFHHARERAMLGGLGQRLLRHQQAVAHYAAKPQPQRIRSLLDFLTRTNHQFGCSRWRGSPQIGNEIENSEIGFMADG